MKYKNITNSYPTIDISAEVSDLKSLCHTKGYKEVVVLDGTVFVGLLHLHDVEYNDDDLKLSEIKHLMINSYLTSDFTLFDWLKLKLKVHVQNIPIVEQDNLKYLGSYSPDDIFKKFQNSGLIVDLSSIIILRKATNDFKYSEIFQIAEANGAKIFGSYIEQSTEEFTDVILNIYHTGLNELLQSFRRYEYDIVSYHDEDQHQETLKSNSDYFAKYLTV